MYLFTVFAFAVLQISTPYFVVLDIYLYKLYLNNFSPLVGSCIEQLLDRA